MLSRRSDGKKVADREELTGILQKKEEGERSRCHS